MNKAWILAAAVLPAGWIPGGADLSGQWTSGIVFTSSGGVSIAQSFTLHLAGPG